jgi:hypothetical protein
MNLRQTSISFPKACTVFSALHTITISPWVEPLYWRDASYKAEIVTDRPASLTCSERYATHLSSLPSNAPSQFEPPGFTPRRLSRRRLPGPPPHPHQSPPATTCNHLRPPSTRVPHFTHNRVPRKALCSCITPPGPGRRYENTLQSIKKPTHHNFSPPVDGLLHADERGRSEAGFGRRLCVELTPDHVSPADGPGCTT